MSQTLINTPFNDPLGAHGVTEGVVTTEIADVEASLASQISDQAQRGHRASAARSLLRGIVVGVIPRGSGSTSLWLRDHVDGGTVEAIIYGLSAFPSICCKGGFEPCSDCGATGTNECHPCETCAGLGKQRCDFCDGTGLLQYSEIPDEMQLQVAAVRIDMIDKSMKALDREPGLELADVKRRRTRLLNVLKLLGVAENVVTSVRHTADEETDSGHPLLRRLWTLVGALQTRRLESLVALKDYWITEADKTPGNLLALHHAAFYADLSTRPGLARTVLANPFLFSNDFDESPAAVHGVAEVES